MCTWIEESKEIRCGPQALRVMGDKNSAVCVCVSGSAYDYENILGFFLLLFLINRVSKSKTLKLNLNV